MPDVLLIFAKNPIPGKTKTRLAATVGNDVALDIYHRLCAIVRDEAAKLVGVERRLYYSREVPPADAWPEERFEKFVQQGDDLGARMEDAFRQTFAGGADRAVIIGTDCPGTTAAYLRRAFTALDTHDVVLGPALDGGYVLLGTRGFHPNLFHDVAWSTEAVAQQTVDRAETAGLTVAQLPALRDVDHEEDWYAYGWPLPDAPDRE